MPTVVAAWTRLIVDYAATRGLTLASPVDLSRPDDRVSTQIDDQLWQTATEQLADPDLGIHMAETAVSAGSFGVVGYLVRASTSVSHALAQVRDFHRLIKDNGRVEIAWSPRGATVIDMPSEAQGPWPRAIAELIAANYVNLTRAWTGVHVVPREVRFQHARPRDTRELERFFGCRLRFDQTDNAIVLSRETLALPFRTAEPALADYLAAWAQSRLEQLGDRAFVDEVRSAIADELRAGTIAIGRVARRLGATPRSLQRRLRAEGLSYRELVDVIRHRQAVELVQRRVPANEIATRLGFSEARAFRRAFRRWTLLAAS